MNSNEHIENGPYVGGSLDIQLGPMFSGKSISALRNLVLYHDVGFKCLFINSYLDVRETTSSNEHITTHHSGGIQLPIGIDQLKVKRLEDVNVHEYDVIHVDEGQFFDDIEQVREWVDVQGKRVSISALDGDSNREVFNGGVMKLIPFADSVVKKRSYCRICLESKKLVHAPFTHRLSDGVGVILPGGADMYIPLCRSCYLRENQ